LPHSIDNEIAVSLRHIATILVVVCRSPPQRSFHNGQSEKISGEKATSRLLLATLQAMLGWTVLSTDKQLTAPTRSRSHEKVTCTTDGCDAADWHQRLRMLPRTV